MGRNRALEFGVCRLTPRDSPILPKHPVSLRKAASPSAAFLYAQKKSGPEPGRFAKIGSSYLDRAAGL
jgi:hypothetical protein